MPDKLALTALVLVQLRVELSPPAIEFGVAEIEQCNWSQPIPVTVMVAPSPLTPLSLCNFTVSDEPEIVTGVLSSVPSCLYTSVPFSS